RLAAAPDLAELAADEALEPEPAGLLHVAVEDRADPVGAAHVFGGGVLGLDPAVDDLGDRLAPGLGEPLELGRDVERVVLAALACPLVDGADAPGELLAVLAQRLDPVGAALEDAARDRARIPHAGEADLLRAAQQLHHLLGRHARGEAKLGVVRARLGEGVRDLARRVVYLLLGPRADALAAEDAPERVAEGRFLAKQVLAQDRKSTRLNSC